MSDYSPLYVALMNARDAYALSINQFAPKSRPILRKQLKLISAHMDSLHRSNTRAPLKNGGTAGDEVARDAIPKGYVLVPEEAGDRDAFMVYDAYMQPGRTRKDAYRLAIYRLSEQAKERINIDQAIAGKGEL